MILKYIKNNMNIVVVLAGLFLFLAAVVFLIGIAYLIYRLCFKPYLEYKKINIGDIYEIKYDDPWLEPERIRIIGKKNKWLRIMKLKDNSCKSIMCFELVGQGYKCIYRCS